MKTPSALEIKNIVNRVGDVKKFLSEEQNLNYEFCPFTVILGAINTTERGYKNLYSTPSDYTSFSKVFTGDEAILAVWDNSYKITKQVNPKGEKETTDEIDYYGIKDYQIGDYFEGILLQDSLTLNFTPSAQNSGFTQQQMTKNVSFLIKNNEKNKKFFDNLEIYFFRLYMLPRLNVEISYDTPDNYKTDIPHELNPTLNVDKQWYYLAHADKIWDKEERKVAYIRISFQSLNDKLSHTGLAINQYVQTSAPGEKCALPAIDIKSDSIILNDKFLHFLPITHVQITFYGAVCLSSICFQGRPVDNFDSNHKTVSERINAPRILLPFSFQAPIYDRLSLKGIAQNDYYIVWGALTLDSYFTSWRENLAQSNVFDETNKKTFEGHFRSSKEITRSTNNVTHQDDFNFDIDNPNYFKQGQHVPFWSDNFAQNLDNNNYSQDININGNQYFQYTQNRDNFVVIPKNVDFFNYDKVTTTLSLHNVLMYSHFLNNTIYQVPLDVRETTSITINSLPFVGSFLNTFFGGISLGFKHTSDNYANIPLFFSLMNCSNYDTTIDTLYATDLSKIDRIKDAFTPKTPKKYDAIIPMNVFDSSADELNTLIGTQTVANSFVFTLTDLIYADSYDYDSKSLIEQENINTVYLNQRVKQKDGSHRVYLVGNKSYLVETDLLNKGFLIDGMSLKVLGKCNYRIDFFSNVNNVNNPINYNYCVYSATYQTLAKVVNNTRLWTENKTFSNPYFKFDEKFNFPKEIIPPSPGDANSKHIFRVIDFDLDASPGDIELKNSFEWRHDVYPARDRTFQFLTGALANENNYGEKKTLDLVFQKDFTIYHVDLRINRGLYKVVFSGGKLLGTLYQNATPRVIDPELFNFNDGYSNFEDIGIELQNAHLDFSQNNRATFEIHFNTVSTTTSGKTTVFESFGLYSYVSANVAQIQGLFLEGHAGVERSHPFLETSHFYGEGAPATFKLTFIVEVELHQDKASESIKPYLEFTSIKVKLNNLTNWQLFYLNSKVAPVDRVNFYGIITNTNISAIKPIHFNEMNIYYNRIEKK